ncbi:alpha/beta fold hydrolase [Halovivax gelatinilyticus]|uniref:alpha/beta fold hydrolase n=1 Tax=Halovivax gelatinilyticus TaxID=2961597 RepID=UPI0020CA4A66|nr:alpha/beta hydrolase [Halovivax gelatinilyticus]
MTETTPPDAGGKVKTHRAVSNDGTEIVGHVYGDGRPLVLVHAGLGDGVLDWDGATAYLSDRFTCYLMSTRGRGSSGDHPDQSTERHVEDVVAFVESVGEPVGLAGPSGGAMFALGAAARSEAVAAVAACDPLAFEVLDGADEARLHDAVERMAELAADDRLVEAARDWMTEWANDREMSVLSESGYLEACAQYVPALLQVLQQADAYSPTDPSVLQRITVPVVLLQGSRSNATWTWFTESVRHVDEHVRDATVREIDGAGHMGAWVEPESYADELVQFFEERHERV